MKKVIITRLSSNCTNAFDLQEESIRRYLVEQVQKYSEVIYIIGEVKK